MDEELLIRFCCITLSSVIILAIQTVVLFSESIHSDGKLLQNRPLGTDCLQLSIELQQRRMPELHLRS